MTYFINTNIWIKIRAQAHYKVWKGFGKCSNNYPKKMLIIKLNCLNIWYWRQKTQRWMLTCVFLSWCLFVSMYSPVFKKLDCMWDGFSLLCLLCLSVVLCLVRVCVCLVVCVCTVIVSFIVRVFSSLYFLGGYVSLIVYVSVV